MQEKDFIAGKHLKPGNLQKSLSYLKKSQKFTKHSKDNKQVSNRRQCLTSLPLCFVVCCCLLTVFAMPWFALVYFWCLTRINAIKIFCSEAAFLGLCSASLAYLGRRISHTVFPYFSGALSIFILLGKFASYLPPLSFLSRLSGRLVCPCLFYFWEIFFYLQDRNLPRECFIC